MSYALRSFFLMLRFACLVQAEQRFSLWLSIFLHFSLSFDLSSQEVLEKEFDEAEAFEDECMNGDGNNGEGGELAAELEIQDAVFMSSYIPRSLHEVCAFVLFVAVAVVIDGIGGFVVAFLLVLVCVDVVVVSLVCFVVVVVVVVVALVFSRFQMDNGVKRQRSLIFRYGRCRR